MKVWLAFSFVVVCHFALAQGEDLIHSVRSDKIQQNVDLIGSVQQADDNGAVRPVYQVKYELFKGGNRSQSSSIMIEAFRKGEISSGQVDGGRQSVFDVTVTPVLNGSVAVDYRLRLVDGKRTFELAKTGVPFMIGSPEQNQFNDSNGDSFDLRVTVIRK